MQRSQRKGFPSFAYFAFSAVKFLLAPDGPGEEKPADQESHAARWRYRAEPADSGDAEEVKTAGKDHDADNKGPAGQRRAALWPTRDAPSNGDQTECVIHLVAHADFKDREHVRREARLEAVGGERSESNTEKGHQRSGGEEKAVHQSCSWLVLVNSGTPEFWMAH